MSWLVTDRWKSPRSGTVCEQTKRLALAWAPSCSCCCTISSSFSDHWYSYCQLLLCVVPAMGNYMHEHVGKHPWKLIPFLKCFSPLPNDHLQKILRCISKDTSVISCAQVWPFLCRTAMQTTKGCCCTQLCPSVFPRAWHKTCHSLLFYSQLSY